MSAFTRPTPKPDTIFKGRPVYFGDIQLSGVDSYFESAYWSDTGEDLTDTELDELAEHCADYLVKENIERFGYYQK